MRYLRQNTDTRITVGPFLDKTDGITPEVALTVTSEKLTLVVDNAGVPTLVLDVAPTASGGANDMVHITGDDSGFYDLELAAANVNYVGRAMLSLNDVATHCPVFHEFMIVPGNVYDSMFGTDLLDVSVVQLLGTAWLAPGVAGTPDVNAKLIGATAQTGRDLGTSVLLSSGTGTGQLDFTSGVVKANLVQILGTVLTETAGYLAAAFKQFFNIASPTSTMNLVTAVTTVTTATTATNLTNAPTSGDFTSTMKTSLNAATPASVTGAVGSVTGAVGSVTGAVGSVTGAVGSVTATVSANLISILGTALTETAGRIAGGFKKFFNVAAPTATCLSLPDAVPGANGGVPTTNGTKISQTVDLTAGQTIAATVAGAVGSVTGAVGSVTAAVTVAAGQIVFKKNVARPNFAFPMFDSAGALKTGLTVTAAIRKDAGAAFAALAGAVTEIGATGWYTVDFAQAETNADTIAFSASASGANPTCYTILIQA
jgi:hypothetical protein